MLIRGRNEELLKVLATKVRIVTEEQAAAVWWDASERGRALCRQTLRALIAEDYLESTTVQAHPPCLPDRPLVTWLPGEAEPEWWLWTWARSLGDTR